MKPIISIILLAAQLVFGCGRDGDDAGGSGAGASADATAAPPAGAAAACIRGDQPSCRIEAEVLRLTNELRAQTSLPPLVLDPKLSFVARSWSAEQARAGTISHSGFPEQRHALYKSMFGTDVPVAAENCAMQGGRTQDELASARGIYDLWRNSPGHRANMLGPYGTLGVGIAWDAAGFGMYGTQIFTRGP